MTASAYQTLSSTFSRYAKLDHLLQISSWDQAAMMPSEGNEARAAAQAELQVIIHKMLTDASLADAFKQIDSSKLSDLELANVREMKREWLDKNALPDELVEAKSLAGSRCEHAWRTQRKENDWQGFLKNFKPVLELSRQEAKHLSEVKGLGLYDSLMDKYEPGMKSENIDKIFTDLKTWLPNLITQVVQKQAQESFIVPQGPFAIDAQKAVGLKVMKALGFNFEAGRLDVSAHPFCGGVPQDVRITTRYRSDDFAQSLMGIVHETGHACYEQSLPREWLEQPVGLARSMGIHESQSLSFEMQMGRNAAFLKFVSPLLQEQFGPSDALSEDNLAKLYTRVKPDFIRVDADELTYPCHIMLRYEIERALIEGEIEAEDIPAIWDEKMMAYLGVDTKGNYTNGCMQDIHWTDGSFGYFPSYTLGAMYAAQFFAQIRAQAPHYEVSMAEGDFSAPRAWLRENIWSQASLYSTNDLVMKATGEVLNPQHFKAHLEARYL